VGEVKGDIIFDDARVSFFILFCFIFHVGARTYVKRSNVFTASPSPTAVKPGVKGSEWH
jgi:hypothetical protein